MTDEKLSGEEDAVESTATSQMAEAEVQDAQDPDLADDMTDAAAPARSRPTTVLIAILALAIAAVAAAASGFLWWQYREFYVSLDSADAQQRETLETVVLEQADFDRLIDDVRLDLQQDRDRFADLQTRITDFPQQVGALSRRLDALQGRSLNARDVWLRAEVEYYLVVANTELSLSGRVESAIAALELADGLLRELGDPALNPVRVAIADELAGLRAIPLVDSEGLGFSLASLATRVPELPFRTGRRDSFTAAQPDLDEVEPGLGRLWESFKQAVGGLVRVERRDAPVEVLLGEAERGFVRRQLVLELQLARIALLRRESESLQASLAAADGLLARDFDVTAAAVSGARELIEELSRLDIAPPQPDISGSLSLLRSTGGADR